MPEGVALPGKALAEYHGVSERYLLKHLQSMARAGVLESGPPGGPGPHPVAVLVHGGYWRRRYGLDVMHALAADLRDAGVAAWNLEYRRVGSPGGGWPGTFEDVAAGADALLAHAAAHGLDARRVALGGHSAG